MLTGDLVRVRSNGKQLMPGYLKPDGERHLERAEEVLGIFRHAVEQHQKRREVQDALGELVGEAVDHKISKGLASLLEKKATWDVDPEVPPAELRARMFQAAATEPCLATADRVYDETAEELGLTVERLRELLFADLKEEQRLVELDLPTPEALIHRYNAGLVQACLLKAEQVTIRLREPTPERARQLFRHVKFHGLMYRVTPLDDGYELHLDGPASLLRLNTRYGMSLARWFPALLLQDRWELEAEVRWTKRRLRKKLQLSSELGMRSHARDTGAWVSRTAEWFEERWARLDTDWKLSREGTPIDLGGQGVVVPDFTFRKGRRVAHMEIVGVWRKAWLANRIQLLQKHGPGNLVLAVSTKLVGSKEKLGSFPGVVVPFKEVVPAKDVLAALEGSASTKRTGSGRRKR